MKRLLILIGVLATFITTAVAQVPYVILNEGTLTFMYGQPDQQVQQALQNGTAWSLDGDWNTPCKGSVTTVVFDPSFVDARPTSCYQWFNDFAELTTVTGMEYLNTSEATDMRYFFHNCPKVTSITIGSGFTVKSTTQTIGTYTDEFAEREYETMFRTFTNNQPGTKLDHGTLIVKGTPTIKKDIFANVFFYGVLTSDTELEGIGKNANGQISWKGGGFEIYNDYYNIYPEYGFITDLGMAKAGTTVTVSVDPGFSNMNMLPKVYYVVGEATTTVSVTETEGGWTFEMPAAPVTITQSRMGAAITLSSDQKTLTIIGMESSDIMQMTNGMRYNLFQEFQQGVDETDQRYENSQKEQYNAFVAACRANVETVVIDKSIKYVSNIWSGDYLFYGFSKLTSVEGLENLNMQNFQSTAYMFAGCSKLTSVEGLENLNMQNFQSTAYMFAGCSSLTNLTIGSNFYIGAAGEGQQPGFDATDMFAGCTGLATGTLTVNGTTAPMIEQNIFGVFTNATMVVESQDLLTLLISDAGLSQYNDGSCDWKGGHFNKKYIGQIPQKSDINPTLSITGWTYGGQPSTPVLTGNEGNGEVTYQYKVKDSDDANYVTYNPAGETPSVPTEVGDYTLKAHIAETENYFEATATADFTISKAAITPTVTLQGWTYGDNANTPQISGNTGSGAVTYSYKVQGANDNTYANDVPTTSGNYTVRATVAETDNYQGATVTSDFTIAKANATMTPPTAIENLVYTGQPQDLITAGSATGGEMQYSLDGQTYDAAIPQGTDANTYTIYYKVVGDANHNDSQVATITSTISQPADGPYIILSDNNTTLTFMYGQKPAQGSVFVLSDDWNTPCKGSVTTVVFDPSFVDARPTTCYEWFKDYTLLTTVTGMEYLNTSEVTDMSYMFANCWVLRSVDLSNFNTAKVTDMSHMFETCTYLDNITIGANFTVGDANTTNTADMFNGTSSMISATLTVKGSSPSIGQDIFSEIIYAGQLMTENKFELDGVGTSASYFILYKGGLFMKYNDYNIIQPTNYYSVSPTKQIPNGEVIITSVPDENGRIYPPRVYYNNAEGRVNIDVTDLGEGKYSFTMPDSRVFIEAIIYTTLCQLSDDKETLTFWAVEQDEYQQIMQQQMQQQWQGGQQGQQGGQGQGEQSQQQTIMGYSQYLSAQKNDNVTDFITACHSQVKTVIFQQSVASALDINGERLLYGFSALTAINGLENLNMKNFSSTKEMFAGCSSLSSLNIGSNFYIGDNTTTTKMFDGCEGLADGTLTVNGTTVPTIEQDIFSIITNGTLVTDPTDLLGELPTENGKYLWKGGKFNSFNGNTVKTAITPTVSISGWAYGDQPSTPVVEGNTGSGAVTFQYKVKDADDNTYQDYNPTGNTPSMPTESGDYTLKVTIAETESYLGATATTDFTIAKADIAVNAITPPEPVTNLMYNRDYQDLITAGSCSFGEMQYSLDGTNYSTDIPKGLEAKEYTVYYKVVGDKNHNDSEPVTVSVTIAPETLAYAVLSDDGTTLTFAYGQAPQGVTYYNAYGGWTHANWNSGVTTVVFDESFANARPTDCIDWFKDFTSLTTVTGMEYLNTTEVTDFTNMFVNCEKLTQLTIGGNFYVGENATTSNMFMSVRDGYDNDTYLDRGTLIVKGTPTIKQNIFANVFFYGTLLSENDLVVSQNANGEISWMGGGFVRYNNYYLVKPEYGFITKDGNDNEIYMAEPGAIVSVSVDPNFQGMTMLPKAVHYDSADREKVSLIKNGEVWTFEMPQYPVKIIQMRLAPAFSWSQDQKTLTVLGVDSEDLQMGQQQQGMSNPMSYMMYMQAQMGMQQNEELTSLINALHKNVETVVFDETVTRLDRGLNGQRLLYGYKNLTTITGMENLGMQNFYSTNEMFAGCSSLTNLTIGSNFYIGAVNDGFTTDDMFTGCTGLAGGTLIIKRGAPNINQDIFTGVFTEGSLIFDPENIEGQLGNQVTTDNDGTKHYKGGIFTTNIEQPENGEVTAESTTVNGDTYVLLYIQPKEKYELTSVSVTYTDESGIVHDVEVTDVSNDTYIIKRFKMPKYSVKIVLVFTLKPENTTEQLSMEANKQWMTYYPSTNDLTLPDGLEAYYVSDVTLSDNGKTGSVTIVSTGNKLYKDVPALIHRTNSSTSALDITATGTRHNDGETIRNSKSANYLGTATDLNLANQANNNIFVLRDGAFIKANPSTIGAHRCWISLGGVSASRLVLRGSDETRIEGIMTVEKQTEWYDMHGRKLDTEPVRKGVYIQNGKKIVVK